MAMTANLISLACLCVAVGIGVGAAADMYHVSPTGDDNGPGTEAEPFATLERAESAVKPGDTVLIKGGLHSTHPEALQGRYKRNLKGARGNEFAFAVWI